MHTSTSIFESAEIVSAVWVALGPLRDFEHRSVGAGGCPSRVGVALRLVGGTPAPARCEPCYDLLVETLLHLQEKASEELTTATNPGAFARVSASRYAVSLLRAQNAAMHGVAKPERSDGAVGRVRRVIATEPDDPAWTTDDLLTMILGAASMRMPVPASVWPYDSFAARKAAHTGRDDLPVLRAEVVTDVHAVLVLVERILGTRWVDDHIHAPLRARAAHYAELRIGEACRDDAGRPTRLDLAASTPADGHEELAAAFWARMDGGDPVEALRDTVRDLGGSAPRASVLRTVVVELVADLPALSAARWAGRARPAACDVRAAVARRCGVAVARALSDRVVDAVVGRLATVPVHHLAPRFLPAPERRAS